MYEGKEDSRSLSREVLDRLCSPKPDWPTPAPLTIKASGMAWQLLCNMDGEWPCINMSWLSLLAVLGTLLLRDEWTKTETRTVE